jgi:hypothetical protein
MLRASRLSEMHALAVQTLSAEPAGVSGRVAAGPAASGPPLQPEMHDAASAAAPSAATQIRLITANLPAPRSPAELRSQYPSGAMEVPFHQTSAQACVSLPCSS